jgi:hypothetical protein
MADAVQQLAGCTQLEKLEVEFNFTVRWLVVGGG